MKTIFKILFITVLSLSLSNCDNDDGNAPNQNACTFQGLTFADSSNNTQTLTPESDLWTDYLTAGSNGPEVEVYLNSDPGFFNFTTTAVTDGGSGLATVNYDGTTYQGVPVTCQRGVTDPTIGALVGDEFRFDISFGSLEMELCVIVDEVTLGYIDADGDGCGSQTVSYTIGVLNNVDTDDTDPNVCF